MENQINFIQIQKDNEEHFKIASKLWVPFICEVNEHDGTYEDEERIINGLKKKIAIQGCRKDMHFEIAIVNGEPFGIAMFAIDLGTVYGLLEKGYGTIMGFYIRPNFRRKGLGTILNRHIETVLYDDGATNMYICPDAVTGEPFWKANGYNNSGKIDPDDKKPIYIKDISASVDLSASSFQKDYIADSFGGKMDFRKTFDKIPENFDRYRPRYCKELFQELELVCRLNTEKKVLEIGPGTGQATEPILKTGCDYTAIELGENFTSFMQNKFSCYQNFHIVNADFENYGFDENIYDLVYSAATIQWIPEEIAFTKTYRMLKPGGHLAMFMTRSDETSANPSLKSEIDRVYEKYFRVKQKYNCKLNYENVLNYGFENLTYKEWKIVRKLNADEYICYISTHCGHITLEEPYKSKFYAGIRKAIVEAGNEIIITDTIPLYLVQKPL